MRRFAPQADPLTSIQASSGFGTAAVSASGDGNLVLYQLQTLGRRPLGYRLANRAHHIDRSLLPCRGTDRADFIVGSALPDAAVAGGGSDTINVRGGGNDTVNCRNGRDTVYADRFDRIGRSCERILRAA